MNLGDIFGRPSKGTGAYTGTDETFGGMFGRDNPTSTWKQKGRSRKRFVDTASPVEYQGRTMYPMMENDKDGPEPTGFYMPAEELADLKSGNIAKAEDRSDRLVYIPPKERSTLKKPQDDAAGDRAGGPLAALAY